MVFLSSASDGSRASVHGSVVDATCFNSEEDGDKQGGILKKKTTCSSEKLRTGTQPTDCFPLDLYNTSVPKLQKTWSGRPRGQIRSVWSLTGHT